MAPALTVRPELPVCCLSPEMVGALLVGARRRRAPDLWLPTEPPAFAADAMTGALVRVYVLPPEERVPALAVPMGEVR
jgi:hypothetical protein